MSLPTYEEYVKQHQAQQGQMDEYYKTQGYIKVGKNYVRDPNFQTDEEKQLKQLQIAQASQNLQQDTPAYQAEVATARTKAENEVKANSTQPLSLADIAKLVDQNNNPAPLNTTQSDLASGKYKLAPSGNSATQKNLAIGFSNALSSINQLQNVTGRINTATNRLSPNYIGELYHNVSKKVQGNDPDVITLANQGVHLLSVIKGLTGSSRILNSEIKNVHLPTIYDTKQEAQTKLDNIRGILEAGANELGLSDLVKQPNQSSNQQGLGTADRQQTQQKPGSVGRFKVEVVQ